MFSGSSGRAGKRFRTRRWQAPTGFVVGVAAIMSSLLALASTAVGAVTDGRHTGPFAGLAAAWAIVGFVLTRFCAVPTRLRSGSAFVGVVAVWLALVAMSTVTYESIGAFATWDDSLFESVAGFTTTASTVVADPESYSRAALLWRAGTQWLGGLAALLFVVAILPSVGVGGLETEPGQRQSGTSLRSRRTVLQLERLAGLYSGLTVIGAVLFLIGGMDPFDAVTYAATTLSTGGFANHAGSFGHFDSGAIEWAGFGGMVLGGANMALLLRGLRRHMGAPILRSFELRTYAAIVLVGGAIVAFATAPEGGATQASIRQAYFHVASAASTTGHFVGGWAGWGTGAQILLLVIFGVGAMSGSAGSGFRLVRALALVGYVRREIVLLVHPNAVSPVRVGRAPLEESLVARMIGYQALYLMVAAAGAAALGALGADFVGSLTGAVSSVANFGPAFGDLAPGVGGVLELPRPARAALMPLMLLGRLEIAPVIVGLVVAASGRPFSRRRSGQTRAG